MNVNNAERDQWRERLCRSLWEYGRMWPAELTTVNTMVEFIQGEPGCFDRATQRGHITGSAWLVDPSGGMVLLNHHRKLDKWLHVGGHADGNGDVLAVAMLEAQEESGIVDIHPVSTDLFDIDIHPIPKRGLDPEHLHFDVRYALRAAHRDVVVSEESHDLTWVAVHQIAPYTTEESMLRMARKWIEQSLTRSL